MLVKIDAIPVTPIVTRKLTILLTDDEAQTLKHFLGDIMPNIMVKVDGSPGVALGGSHDYAKVRPVTDAIYDAMRDFDAGHK